LHNSGVILVARTGSTRLKEKVLRKLGNNIVFELLINRIKKSKVEKIILATTKQANDDKLVDLAKHLNLKVFRGSEIDTLDRFYQCAKENNIENIILVEGDEVFTDPKLVDDTLELLEGGKANIVKVTDLPVGMMHLGIKFTILEKVWNALPRGNSDGWGAKLNDIEGVNPTSLLIPSPWDKLVQLNYRLTLDYPEDLELITKIYKDHGFPSYIDTHQLVLYLINNPELSEINSHKQLEWKKNLNLD
jgi:spore coat polysaccharide biosynthesis protein SpsF